MIIVFYTLNPWKKESMHLPRIDYCAGLRCKLFHFGQPKSQRQLTCTKCWATDHTMKFCKNNPRCKVCKLEGHKPGDKICPSFESQSNVIEFNGEDNILSNFFPCELNIYGFTHKSAEHAFQYAKAVRCGDLDTAKTIQEAKDTLSAKRLGDKIRPNVYRFKGSGKSWVRLRKTHILLNPPITTPGAQDWTKKPRKIQRLSHGQEKNFLVRSSAR